MAPEWCQRDGDGREKGNGKDNGSYSRLSVPDQAPHYILAKPSLSITLSGIRRDRLVLPSSLSNERTVAKRLPRCANASARAGIEFRPRATSQNCDQPRREGRGDPRDLKALARPAPCRNSGSWHLRHRRLGRARGVFWECEMRPSLVDQGSILALDSQSRRRKGRLLEIVSQRRRDAPAASAILRARL
ncbi:hypothetical protein Purlil1_5876 [Purpureocillium lilacinum]|uniref:Uncharacterized protein n=1 Tax=Purpureocillium lilacinum TaxID=33203 RepID=A0ABR0C0A8_PURLI|nr:hypothetical protein Purlil1_5876 [Purpureocillium lilacinum]